MSVSVLAHRARALMLPSRAIASWPRVLLGGRGSPTPGFAIQFRCFAAAESSSAPGDTKKKPEGILGVTAEAPAEAQRSSDAGEVRSGSDNIQFTWRSALFTCCSAGAFLLYYEYVWNRRLQESRATVHEERIGVPRLGGPFELVDRKGKAITDQDLKGQYLLIYFGFTFCPDICPQEMEKQSHAIELLDEEFGPVATPVFISIDPRRDTVELVDDYCKEFHPRIQGLTGTPEQVKKVSRAYRVYYNEGIKTDEMDYLIDHSIIHYFMGKDGKFIDFFGKNMTAKEIAAKMRATILIDQEKARARKQRRGVEDAESEE